MDDDLRRGLITKKTGFDKLYEDALIKVSKIRQQNDAFQRHAGPEIDQDLKNEVHSQNKFIEKEIKELKNILNQIDSKYRDPESKNKAKQLKLDAQKQIQRNKRILKDLIKESFDRKSFGHQNDDPNENYIEGKVIDYTHLNGNQNVQGNKKESTLTEQQDQLQHVQIDYEVERKMLLEKTDMIKDVEQSSQRINQIISEQGIMVQEQGHNLDVISEELMNTNKNLTKANEDLDEAQTYQKKSKKKYIFLVVLIIIIIAAAAGVIFFLVK